MEGAVQLPPTFERYEMRAASSSKLISLTHPTLHLSHPTPDAFFWNSLIRAHPAVALSLYRRMLLHGVRPDLYTFPFLLLSFSSPSPLPPAALPLLHAHALLSGFASHPFVRTSLVSAYSHCSSLPLARRLFDEIPLPDLPSWNSIISAYLRAGLLISALQIFVKMPERNVVAWSCMIDGFVKCGDHRGALQLFRDMQREAYVKPNEFTMSSVLAACAKLGALEHGKWAHAYIDRSGMKVNMVLGTSLIDMYAKCGSIDRARLVFDSLGPDKDKDIKAWSAMISGLAIHGLAMECLDLFLSMRGLAVIPNAITFLGVLSACVHARLVNEGEKYFEQMVKEFGIDPMIQHYGCIVDLYARAGLIGKAWDVVNSMPMKPDVLIWGALLSGSRMHGDIETCKASIKQLIELEPTNSGAYVLLSNAYAKRGRWDDVRRVRNRMEELGIKKTPGCSLVEVHGHLHEFFVADRSHPEMREISLMLEEIMGRLTVAGYVGNTEEGLLDLDEEGKELALSLHSEKLAIAFSLIKTSPGTAIRIIKNLRICMDCHVAIKLISKIYDRGIVVRDCSRFHYFRDGFCSCKDYW
ncbi:pentatricopeptide repeat-containing protein At3g62890 [Phoenix dactylifera]|uniref:Pentatricopeptide repeat-containing protein At3g62890 n=1 Tax=Phoenix dactylifera TaxID=42345 RepID=A0A8B7C1Y2_PHODC|nr:pentatricopeptide repeat-containing protein At3g62890 [Phoenix dactylifera]